MDTSQTDRRVLHQAVAAEVRAQLARNRLSGNRVAKALGWGQTYISRRLTGEVAFDVADLMALAELLEVPVSVFFEPPQVSGGLRRAPIRWVVLALRQVAALILGPAGISTLDQHGPAGPSSSRTNDHCRSGLGLAA